MKKANSTQQVSTVTPNNTPSMIYAGETLIGQPGCGVWPACGYCPHCGRGGQRFIPYQPWPVYPYIGDPLPYQQPYIWCGATTSNQTMCSADIGKTTILA